MASQGGQLSFMKFEFNNVDSTESQGQQSNGYNLQPHHSASSNFGSNNRSPSVDDFENEPPLLEELGINVPLIFQRTFLLLNPFRAVPASLMQEGDLAGPLLYCLILGLCLFLSGKMYFGIIYGWCTLGLLGVWSVLNLLAGSKGDVELYKTCSIIGYCLLPNVCAAAILPFVPGAGATIPRTLIASVGIAWSTWQATKLFSSMFASLHACKPLACWLLFLQRTYYVGAILLHMWTWFLASSRSTRLFKTHYYNEAEPPIGSQIGN